MNAEEYAEAVQHISEAVDYVIGGGSDPGTGVCYFNDVFEIHGFWNHDDDCDWEECYYEHVETCRYHELNNWYFYHYETGFKYSWYKRIGRSASVVGDVEPRMLDWYQMVVECLESVKNDPNPDWKCKSAK